MSGLTGVFSKIFGGAYKKQESVSGSISAGDLSKCLPSKEEIDLFDGPYSPGKPDKKEQVFSVIKSPSFSDKKNHSSVTKNVRLTFNSLKRFFRDAFEFVGNKFFSTRVSADALRNIKKNPVEIHPQFSEYDNPVDSPVLLSAIPSEKVGNQSDRKVSDDGSIQQGSISGQINRHGSIAPENKTEDDLPIWDFEDLKAAENSSAFSLPTPDQTLEFMEFHESYQEARNKNRVFEFGEINHGSLNYARYLMAEYKDKQLEGSARLEVGKLLESANALIIGDSDRKLANQMSDSGEILENIRHDLVDESPSEIAKKTDRDIFIDQSVQYFVSIFLLDNNFSLDKDDFNSMISDAKKFISWRQNWWQAIFTKDSLIYSPGFGEVNVKDAEKVYLEKNYKIIDKEYKEQYPLSEEDLLACRRFVEKFNNIKSNGTDEQKRLLDESDLQKYVDDFEKNFSVSANDDVGEAEQAPVTDSINHAGKVNDAAVTPVMQSTVRIRLDPRPNISDFPNLDEKEKAALIALLFPSHNTTDANNLLIKATDYFQSISNGFLPTDAEQKSSAIEMAHAWSNLDFFSKSSAIYLNQKFYDLNALLVVEKINKNFIEK